MIKKWIVTLLACAVIAGILVAYKVWDNRTEQQAVASAPEYAETVAAVTVYTIDYQPAVNVLGQVVSPQQVALRNELAGTIAEVNFAPGARVEKDQLLIQLDVREEQAQLQSAIARAELARATQKRISRLRDTNAVSQEQYDRALAELKVALADKAVIEASIAKKTLRAPFDAVAGLHQFEPGQYLEENTLVTTLVGVQDYVWVDFSLPQVYPPLPNQTRVTIVPLDSPARTGVSERSWSAIEAAVIARESLMRSESRSLKYRARVDGGKAGLLANSIVGVRVPLGTAQTRLALPAVAVLHSTAGPYVYLLKEDQSVAEQPAYRAQRQPVTLGDQQDDLVIIDSGLEAGQRVAGAGSFKLSEGLLTYLTKPAPAPVAQGETTGEDAL